MPTVYHGDHTEHLRHRLARIALTGALGLLFAGLGALILLLVPGQSAPTLTRWVWILDGVLVALSLAWLMLAAIGWGWYCQHRADLDAEGAEAEGELRARMHRHLDDPPPHQPPEHP